MKIIIKNRFRFTNLLILSIIIISGCASKNTSRSGTRQLLNNSGKANKPGDTGKKSAAEDPFDKMVRDYVKEILYAPTPTERYLKQLVELRKKEVENTGRGGVSQSTKSEIYCDGYFAGLRKAISDARVLEDVSVSGEKKK